MKVTQEHYNATRGAMRRVIENHGADTLRDYYETGKHARSENTKDLNERFRWDVYHAANCPLGPVYGEYTDKHKDTALRSIMKELGLSDLTRRY